MSFKQIQHLYEETAGGYAAYHHTEVVELEHQDRAEEVIHLLILKEIPLPTREQVLELLTREELVEYEEIIEVPTPEINRAQETFYGVPPSYYAGLY